jgi:hypothetical protein
MSTATARGSTSQFRAASVHSSDAQPQERELEQTDSTMDTSRARTRESGAYTDTATTNAQGLDASVSDDERRRMIAETAYYIAQRRGFDEGLELEDWLAAEAEVSARLAAS